MGVMPNFPGNPRQKWQFQVLVDGMPVAWFQAATLPTVGVEQDTFNPAGSIRPTKFAGRLTYGDATLAKGMPSENADMAAFNWLTQAANAMTGDAGNPAEYKRDVEIVHLDKKGVVVQSWILHGAYCSQVEWEQNEGSSDHEVETLTLSVDWVEEQ